MSERRGRILLEIGHDQFIINPCPFVLHITSPPPKKKLGAKTIALKSPGNN